jgi:K+-transporting ATPase KdpF subunit
MSALHILGGILALALLIYLFVALFLAEKF